MASYDIDTLHEHILQILLSVDKVCREHHLTYYCWFYSLGRRYGYLHASS